MELRRLQIFNQVAKHQSVTKAAVALLTSQPAISLQIKTLEGELDLRLIRKNGRGIALTLKGAALYRELESPLFQLEQITEKYFKKSPKHLASEQLVVGGGSGVTANLLPSLVAKLIERRPGARIRLVTARRDGEIEDQVVKGLVDIGVVANPVFYAAVRTEPFRREEFVVFAAANHPLSRKGAVSMDDIETFPMVTRSGLEGEDRTASFLSRLTNGAVHLNNTISAESTSGLKSLVHKGVGIGIIYHDAIAEELATGKFKELKFPLDLSIDTFIVYNREKPLSRLASTFLALLRQVRTRAVGKTGRS